MLPQKSTHIQSRHRSAQLPAENGVDTPMNRLAASYRLGGQQYLSTRNTEFSGFFMFPEDMKIFQLCYKKRGGAICPAPFGAPSCCSMERVWVRPPAPFCWGQLPTQEPFRETLSLNSFIFSCRCFHSKHNMPKVTITCI